MIAVFMLLCTNGLHAQTTQTKLDQVKLMQQSLGTWEANVGKDTVQVSENKQYGKSFINNVSLVIKGKKTPYYTNNFCFDSKDGKFKGFGLYADGRYLTWIGLYTNEKMFTVDIVQNFKPEPVLRKIEMVRETPSKQTWTFFNADGTKAQESKYNKVK
jgi:hypothetical protein